MRRLTLFVASLLAVVSMGAENLTTYYSRIDGLKKEELKTTLGSIIKNHKSLGYSSLGSYYPDVYYCDGSTKGSSKAKVYDLFSDEVYLYSSSSIWNKEHVVPKSWWGGSESAPQGNDIFSVIPSQTTANSNKSNYPPGIVNRNKSYKDSGRQLVGEATAGTGGSYSKVWEPYDDYKGDFARIIFYVATCYADVAWGSKGTVDSEIDKNSWPTLKPWLYQMLLKWHNDDPVSAKEIQINDDAQAVQGNRNPFIDYPILADYIWGSLTTTAFNLSAAVPHKHIDGSGDSGDDDDDDDDGGNTGGDDDDDDDDGGGNTGGNVEPGTLLMEDTFDSATSGSNTTSDSSSAWSGDDWFQSIYTVFQADGALRIGSSKTYGSVTSKPIPYSGGSAIVEVEVKGWTTVEGPFYVNLGGTAQAVEYSSTMSGGFEKKSVSFTDVPANPVLKLSTSSKRCFVDAVRVYAGVPSSVQPQTAVDGDAVVYDLMGRRVSTTSTLPTGIYIVDGRKVVVK